MILSKTNYMNGLHVSDDLSIMTHSDNPEVWMERA